MAGTETPPPNPLDANKPIGPLDLATIKTTLEQTHGTPITHFNTALYDRTDNLRFLPGHLIALAQSPVASGLILEEEIYLVDGNPKQLMGIISGEKLVDRARALPDEQKTQAIKLIAFLVEQEVGQEYLETYLTNAILAKSQVLAIGARLLSQQLQAAENIRLLLADIPEYADNPHAKHAQEIVASSGWRKYIQFIKALVPEGPATTEFKALE